MKTNILKDILTELRIQELVIHTRQLKVLNDVLVNKILKMK